MKIKRMALFICIMAMLLAACQDGKDTVAPEPTATSTPTPEPTATSTPTPEPTSAPWWEDTYVKGTITDTCFESEWMNLRFTLQTGMYMYTQEEVDKVMKQGAELIVGESTEINFGDSTNATEMMAQYANGANAIVFTEKISWLYSNITEEEYINIVLDNIRNGVTKPEVVASEFYTTEIGGETYTGISVAADYGAGIASCQEYMVRKKESRIIGIVVSYPQGLEQSMRNLIECFGAFDSEPVILPEPTPYPSTYTTGILSENSFESEWLNLRFMGTDEVTMRTREEILVLWPLSANVIYGDDAEKRLESAEYSLYVEMMAVHNLGGSLLVQTERLPLGYEDASVETYLAIIKNDLLNAANATYIIGEELYEAELAGEKYIGFSSEMEVSGEKTYQEFWCRKKENRMISIIISYGKETTENALYLLDLLKAYDSKPVILPEPTATVAPIPQPTTAPGVEKDIVVGPYKGLVLTGVSQNEVDAEIAAMLEYYAQVVVVDRAAQEGDIVNIDYVGMQDGVAFEGGTDVGYNLTLGSDVFIDGFEDGLIGAVAGEFRELQLTFPEDYGSADLAGQTVVFMVTINEVMEEVVPELTDEFIAQEFIGFTTVAQYTEYVREALNAETFAEQATEQMMASSEVKHYDETEVEKEKQRLISEYTAYAEYYGSYYGLDLETSVKYILGFESIKAFEETMGEYAYETVKNIMIVNEIAALEGIEVTDDIFTEKTEEYAGEYGYADAAEFLEYNEEEIVRRAILSDLVIEFIIENAIIL